MTEIQPEFPTVVVLNQLIEDLLKGPTRRPTFSRCEVEFLLELDNCEIRKTARPNLLKRYQRVMLQQAAKGHSSPMTLSAFIAHERQRRELSQGIPAASLSSRETLRGELNGNQHWAQA